MYLSWQQDRKLGGTADIFRPMCVLHMGFFVCIRSKSQKIYEIHKKRRAAMKEKLEQIKAEALRQIEASDALDSFSSHCSG